MERSRSPIPFWRRTPGSNRDPWNAAGPRERSRSPRMRGSPSSASTAPPWRAQKLESPRRAQKLTISTPRATSQSSGFFPCAHPRGNCSRNGSSGDVHQKKDMLRRGGVHRTTKHPRIILGSKGLRTLGSERHVQPKTCPTKSTVAAATSTATATDTCIHAGLILSRSPSPTESFGEVCFIGCRRNRSSSVGCASHWCSACRLDE